MDPNRLKAIPLFASLDDQTRNDIASLASETSVPAGKELVREGDYAYEFMAIEEGEAEVLHGGKRVATLGPGDFFGEIAVLEKSLRLASVVALTPMRLMTLSRWDLKRIGDETLDQIRATIGARKSSLG